MMKKTINIAIIGIGGVGGYFGGKLVYNIEKSKNTDYNVYFIAHGNHLKSIKTKGLILKTSDNSQLICRPVLAAENLKEIPQPDIIILAVKSYDLESAINQISSSVTKNTIILPLLNGIDIYERIRKKIKNGIILPSCVYISSHIEKPGVVSHRFGEGLVILGPDPQHREYIPAELLNAFKLFGISYRWQEDVNIAIWEKYIFIASYALVTAYADKSIGEVFSDYNLKEITRQIILEIYNIGLAKGIKLDDYVVENTINKARTLPHLTKTSYQLDIEANGSRNESNIFAETIINMSRETKIPVPETKKIYNQLLKIIESRSAVV